MYFIIFFVIVIIIVLFLTKERLNANQKAWMIVGTFFLILVYTLFMSFILAYMSW